MEYSVFEATPEYAIFTFDNFVGAIWRKALTETGVKATLECSLQHAAAHGKIFVAGFAPANIEVPAYAATAAMRSAFRELNHSAVASFVIHWDTGLRLQTVKAVTSTISMFAGLPFPYKAFGSVGEAAHWLCSHYGVDVDRFVTVVNGALSDLHGPDLPPRLSGRSETI